MRPTLLNRTAQATRPARTGGFSLIELMVALVLGLIVTGAVISTFISVHSASNDTAGIAELADNGRIALDILQQTVRSAGYMACNSTLRQLVSPGLSPTPLTGDFTEALSGYEASGSAPGSALTLQALPPGDSSQGDWDSTPELGGALDSSVISEGNMSNALPIKGSDVIAVHTTYSQIAPVYTTADSGANTVSVQSTTGLAAGQLAVISNCANSVVDEIQGVSGSSVSFVQSLGETFAPGAQIGVVDTFVFYIGKGTDGDGALYSYSLAGNPTFTNPPAEIAPDIENMQILYGVDTTGSLAATEYVTADQLSNAVASNPNCAPIAGTGGVEFNCVVSVKIALLVASPLYAIPKPTTARTYNLLGTLVTAPIDTRLRQVFETTISLRNTTN